MKSYKKWSAEERRKSLNLTNEGLRLGLIQRVCKCQKCGQTEGILQLHNEDYDVTLEIMPQVLQRFPQPCWEGDEEERVKKVLWHLCWRCHMIHHSLYRNPAACHKYWAEVAQGICYPPVFKHNFNILARDHGIN